jgi:hypothetical protein
LIHKTLDEIYHELNPGIIVLEVVGKRLIEKLDTVDLGLDYADAGMN